MPFRRTPLLLLIGVLTLASGCSSRKPVKVLLTLDGKPVEGATVVLVGDASGPAISGFTGADGTATLDSSNSGGVPPGNYKVLVTKVKPLASASIDAKNPNAMKGMMNPGGKPKSELPESYGDAKATPLTLKVPADSSPAKIELKSKP